MCLLVGLEKTGILLCKHKKFLKHVCEGVTFLWLGLISTKEASPKSSSTIILKVIGLWTKRLSTFNSASIAMGYLTKFSAKPSSKLMH